MRSALAALSFAFALASAFAGAASAQTEALHSLKFAIHDSLVGGGAGQMSLPEWQTVLDGALLQASTAIQGYQGPADTACCSNIEADALLSTFSGAAFQTIDSAAKFDNLEAQEGPGIYIVLDISFCGSPNPSLLGCAETPGDFLVVDLDDPLSLGLTIAHELGHNTGLPHAFADSCRLMSGANGGGCLSAAECQSFVDGANANGDSCDCLLGVQGPAVADGSECTHPSDCGLCSGGRCGACTSEAAAQLFAGGDTAVSEGGNQTDLLAVSSLTGGFATVGDIGSTINGLAYDATRGVLWGLLEGGGSPDQLVTIDPATGAVTTNFGAVGSPAVMDLVALAFDPGADLLYAIESTSAAFGIGCQGDGLISVVRTIDPDDHTISTQLGAVEDLTCFPGTIEGLAYDAANDALWGSYAFANMLIDPGNCSGALPTCASTVYQYEDYDGGGGPLSTRGTDWMDPSALAYEATSGRLFKAGYSQGTGMPLFQVFDAGTGNPIDMETGALQLLMGTDGYSISGLAAVPFPAPEAGAALLNCAALAALAGLARRRRREWSP